MNDKIIKWLLAGDVSIQYQVHRDLLESYRSDLQNRIENEGWGADFFKKRNINGHWGQKFYQPKWTSTHYTVLDIRHLNIKKDHHIIKTTIDQVAINEKAPDGGILPIGEIKKSDMCINGMFLNYASYFKTDQIHLESVVDCLLEERMSDGGFNCRSNRSGARHSSMHTTISVLEGLEEYLINGYTHRIDEVKTALNTAKEFLLIHRLFKSDRTGEIIHKDFLRLSYPSRWKYDILRALDFWQYSDSGHDHRLEDALEHLVKMRKKDDTWHLRAHYPGQQHFQMEQTGKPSRWNTLRALRVFKYFGIA